VQGKPDFLRLLLQSFPALARPTNAGFPGWGGHFLFSPPLGPVLCTLVPPILLVARALTRPYPEKVLIHANLPDETASGFRGTAYALAERTQPSPGLLPVPDRFGLWKLSIRNVISLGAAGRQNWRHPIRSLGMGCGYLLVFTILYGLALRSEGISGVSQWNLSVGLALGALLTQGWTYLPVVLLGYLLAPVALGGASPPAELAVSALGQTVAVGIGVVLIRRLARGTAEDLTNRSVFALFVAIAPVVALLGPLMEFVGAAALSLDGFGVPVDLAETLGYRFLGNLAGIVSFGPISMIAFRRATTCGVSRGLSGVTEQLRAPQTWPLAWRAGLVLSVFTGALYAIVSFPLSNQIGILALISLPLVVAALLFGLCGVAPVLAAFGLLGAAAPHVGYGPETALQLGCVLAGLNSGVLGLLVTEQRRHQHTMNHQAALIGSVSFATEQLLGMTDQEKNVQEVLRHLAAEAHLGRVYVLENRHHGRDTGFPVLYELGDVISADRKDALGALCGKYIRRSTDSLEQGRVLEIRASELAAEDQALFVGSSISETLILPIFSDGHWWGCLGMDHGLEASPWTPPEISTFEATARVLGALLAHTNVEQQFRQFTGSIPVVFWIASPDVMHKTYVSPAYEQIWGRPREGVRENPRSWMAAIYHEDYTRLSEVLEGNPQAELAEEYRIVRPDRSVRWIRDTGFTVRDASGQVNRIVGIAQDITPQKEAEERLKSSEEQIRSSLNEKEVLLKEIHHRVKNNLQVISSLLSLQATQIRDKEAAQVFRDSQSRVRAMALVHERLYQSEDLARIDFAGYVRDMTSHLLRSYQSEARAIRLELEAAGVALDVDAAIPCALIINEIVSNAFKYAFPDDRQGEIRISLDQNEGEITMVISDNGVGLPEGMSFEQSGSLGLQLVHSLTDQLGGRVQCSTSGGTTFEIRFPYDR